MIQRSLVILISLGYLSPLVGDPAALYAAYHGYNRKLVEQLVDQGNGSRAEQLEKALDVAVKTPDAATAVLIQEDLIEAQKSWFARHYRITTLAIPTLAFIAVGYPLARIFYFPQATRG